jgi:hypothetical protein
VTKLWAVFALAAAGGASWSGAAMCAPPEAGARVPVQVYLMTPNDRPDPATRLVATKPVTREVKHVASSWGGPLFQYFDVGPDCQPTELTTTVIEPPAHGRFTLNDVSIPPFKLALALFPKGDPRQACSRLPMRNGFYRPDPGFVGRDHLVVAFREGDSAFTDSIEVEVRRAERPMPVPFP